MKTEHTPGPWNTDIEIAANLIRRGESIEQAAIYVDHGSGKGGEICALRHDPSDGLDLTDAEQQANARLIAAAPLMAECLLLIEGAMAQAKDVRGTDRYSMEFTASALNGIRAALDQALGR